MPVNTRNVFLQVIRDVYFKAANEMHFYLSEPKTEDRLNKDVWMLENPGKHTLLEIGTSF